MVFTWKQCKEDVIKHQIKRQKLQAKKQSPDFKLKHAGESRDADKGEYTVLIKRVTEEMKDKQELALQRRAKQNA